MTQREKRQANKAVVGCPRNALLLAAPPSRCTNRDRRRFAEVAIQFGRRLTALSDYFSSVTNAPTV